MITHDYTWLQMHIHGYMMSCYIYYYCCVYIYIYAQKFVDIHCWLYMITYDDFMIYIWLHMAAIHDDTWLYMIDIVCLRDFAILQYRNTLSFVILFECIVPESTRCPSNPEEDLENSAAWHANSSWTKAGDTAASSSLMLAMLVFAAQLRCTFSIKVK